MGTKNFMLLLAVLALCFLPLALGGGAEFLGADGQAQELITNINPQYQPWFDSLWEPQSSEVESFIFALQAALGSGFLGYYFGFIRGKQKGQKEKEQHVSN